MEAKRITRRVRVVKNDIEQRTVDFHLAVVIDETQLPESIEKETDA